MNLEISKAPYLVLIEWEIEEERLNQAIKIWTENKVSLFFEKSRLYKGLNKNTLLVLYEVSDFADIQMFLESEDFKLFVNQQSQYMKSDFRQSVVGLVEKVVNRSTFIPNTRYIQLRHIEVPLSDIDRYLEWRRKRIFEFVKKNDKVTSFLAFHSFFSSEPGVLFVVGFEENPNVFRNSFLTDEYKEIIKEAGHSHIKNGEKGLITFEYERVIENG